MPPDKGNPSIHVIYCRVSPVVRFVMVQKGLPASINFLITAHKVLKSRDLAEKNYGDSKYYSQFDRRAFPDYENLSRASLYIYSILGYNLLLHDFYYVIYVNFLVISPHLS